MDIYAVARWGALSAGAAIVILWLAFIRTDEFGLTAWEYTKDVFVSDDWVGWIHPFGNEGRVLKVGPFDSVRHCQTYAFEHLEREYDSWDNAEYYCGYECSSADHFDRESECKVIRK